MIKKAAHNIALAIGGLNGFVSTKVQNSTSVLRFKFSAKNPAHRQYVNRYRAFISIQVMNKNMRHMIQIFLSLIIITSCQQQKSEKDEGLEFAKQVIETYFDNDCKANYNFWADSIVLMGFDESKMRFKERFPSDSVWCNKFNKKQRFHGEYSFLEYLNDYDLRIYEKSEFTNKKLMMEKEKDSGISNYLHNYHFLFSDNDYYFSGGHLKDDKSQDRINHQGNWEMIISKTDQGWKIVGTLP